MAAAFQFMPCLISLKFGRWVACATLAIGVLTGPPVRAETPAEHLMALVESQDLDRIGAYLAQPGVNVDDRPGDFKTLLDFAAERNRVKVAEYLIDHGADVNAMPKAPDNGLNHPGLTALCLAAYTNSLEVMDLLLRHGAEVNSLPGRESALIYAAYNGSLGAVKVLVEHGADVNHEFGVHQTAVSEAMDQKHVEVVRYLMDHGASLGPGAVYYAAITGIPEFVELALAHSSYQEELNPALAMAAANNRVDEATRQRMLGLLLAHGADPDAPQNGLPHGMMPRAFTADTAAYLLDHGANSHAKLTGYQLAAGFGCNGGMGARDALPLDRMLVARGMDFKTPDGSNENPVVCAVVNNRTDLIDYLLDHGADIVRPDWGGFPPIFHATTRPVVEDLLRHGANLNQTIGNARTPLSFAIESRQWNEAALLLTMGAEVHANEESLLSQAASNGRADLVSTLLDHGANINARGLADDTALMDIVRAGQMDMARLLLDHGADVNLRNRTGRTALHLAVEAGNTDMVKLLLMRGASRTIVSDDGVTPLGEARSAELRQLLADHSLAVTDGSSGQDIADCAAALAQNQLHPLAADQPLRTASRDLGEDWDYLDQVAGDARAITLQGRQYLLAVSDDAGYLGRIDADGVERIVCEYGRMPQGTALRPLSEYERLQARVSSDFGVGVKSVSQLSVKLQGLRGAKAILAASRRARDPVPLAFNSDDNLLNDAIGAHRDDILAYYLEHGVDANLAWRDHKVVDQSDVPPWHSPPLYAAVVKGTDHAVDLLLSHGAGPDAAEPPPFADNPQWVGKPALAFALLNRDESVVEALLSHGADPDMPSAHGNPPGIGIYSGFHQALGGDIEQWVHEWVFNQAHRYADVVANATVLFLHGGSPDPWLYSVLSQLQLWAHNNVPMPEAIRQGIATAPKSDQVSQVADGVRAAMPPVADLLTAALRFRDAPLCDTGSKPEDLRYCLPKSLRVADADLNGRYEALLKAPGTEVTGARAAQRAWIVARDKACGVKELPGVTQSGWLAYVLSDQAKAQCVLQKTRSRAAALPLTSG